MSKIEALDTRGRKTQNKMGGQNVWIYKKKKDEEEIGRIRAAVLKVGVRLPLGDRGTLIGGPQNLEQN